MRILIATDAWRPQVNGVVHTLEALARAAEGLGESFYFPASMSMLADYHGPRTRSKRR